MKRILNLAPSSRTFSQTLPAAPLKAARKVSAARLEEVRPTPHEGWNYFSAEATTAALAERAYYRVQKLGASDGAPLLNRTV